MKNKLVLLILAVALFIPSAVAIASYTNVQTAPVSAKNAAKMTLADLAGNEYTFERTVSSDDESSKIIDFFLTMNENATQVTALPDALMGQPFFKVVLSTLSKDSAYQYYFTSSPSEAYFLDPSGIAYQIRAEDASQFIVTKYAASMYSDAEFPALLLSNQYTVKPNTAAWNYKNYSQNYVSANLDAYLTTELMDYPLEGGFEMAFSVEPDYLALKVVNSNDGQVLFDDLYENISALSFDKNMKIAVDITARWYEDSSRSYYGEAYYKFTTSVSAPAEFYLAKSEIQPGDFVVLSGINVSNPDKIIFSAEPSIEYEPRFFTEGETVNALIPIRAELTPGSYTFTVTYGGVSQTMTLTVAAKDFRTLPYNVTQTLYNTYHTDVAIDEYNTQFAEITASTSADRLWKGSFADTPANGSALIAGFGHTRTLNINNYSYRMTGVDYSGSNLDITAVNDGKVVYVQILDYSGYTVVIDHGWGLKTWYMNIGSADVKVGDTVTKGTKIGTTGNTGFTNHAGVYFMMTVYNVPVSPYKLWDSGDGGVLVYPFGE